MDFFLKQLAYQFPLENSGGELSNSRTDLLPHQILLTHQIVNARRRRFLIADEVGLGKTIEVGMIIKDLTERSKRNKLLRIHIPIDILVKIFSDFQGSRGFKKVLESIGVALAKAWNERQTIIEFLFGASQNNQ